MGKQTKRLEELLSEIAYFLPHYNTGKTEVSKVSVGWHLAHVLIVLDAVIIALEKSKNKVRPAKRFNIVRIVCFVFNHIPRGKGKAPKVAMPLVEEVTESSLKQKVVKVKAQLQLLETLPETVYFEHFIFGCLSKKQTLRFLAIHTKHHLKIVKDILKT